MPRHDSIFKRLFRSFLADLLSLAAPDLAARLDLAHPALLDKEFFTCQLHRKNHLNELEVPSAGHSRLSKALPLDCTSGEVLQRRSVLGQGAVAKRAGQG